MKPASGQTGAPVIYAGRFAEEVSESLPDSQILDEWGVLPHQLAETTREATGLVVLDPLSFPFEAMTDEQWELPLLVMPPPEFDAETLITVFGPALLDLLGPFDRVATADPNLWDTLRRRYSWANGQRLRLGSRTPGEAAAELRALLESPPGPLRREKAAHRTEARALAPRIADLRQPRANEKPPDVLEVGAGDGRWPTTFSLSETRFSGVYTGEEPVEAAHRDFPEHTFSPMAKDYKIAQFDDTFDLSFSVNFIRVQPDSVRKALVSEMWRVTRPGGRMIFLEDFVSGGLEGSGVSSLSVSGFVELVAEATAGRVMLDHVESLLYPGEDMVRGGLISLQKPGSLKDG
ncbi:MAG: class I SAM-dependent methyltransferase [Rubrobacteraceae bacterium]